MLDYEFGLVVSWRSFIGIGFVEGFTFTRLLSPIRSQLSMGSHNSSTCVLGSVCMHTRFSTVLFVSFFSLFSGL